MKKSESSNKTNFVTDSILHVREMGVKLKNRSTKGMGLLLPFILTFFSLSFSAHHSNFHNIETNNSDSIYFYKIKMDSTLSKRKVLRFQKFRTLKFINGQDLISYDYCNSQEECDSTIYDTTDSEGNKRHTHDELTGRIESDSSYWIHPPRDEYFTVLELNAFPYYVKNKNEWNFDLIIGDHWGDERWITWEGSRVTKSTYKLADSLVNYSFRGKKIKCYKIVASTKIENLGETSSVFYFNRNYGFVFMSFRTINNKLIEFEMK